MKEAVIEVKAVVDEVFQHLHEHPEVSWKE